MANRYDPYNQSVNLGDIIRENWNNPAQLKKYASCGLDYTKRVVNEEEITNFLIDRKAFETIALLRKLGHPLDFRHLVMNEKTDRDIVDFFAQQNISFNSIDLGKTEQPGFINDLESAKVTTNDSLDKEQAELTDALIHTLAKELASLPKIPLHNVSKGCSAEVLAYALDKGVEITSLIQKKKRNELWCNIVEEGRVDIANVLAEHGCKIPQEIRCNTLVSENMNNWLTAHKIKLSSQAEYDNSDSGDSDTLNVTITFQPQTADTYWKMLAAREQVNTNRLWTYPAVEYQGRRFLDIRCKCDKDVEPFIEINGLPGQWWEILKQEQDRVLLVATFSAGLKLWDRYGHTDRWDNCTLRTWLNEKFYSSLQCKDAVLKTTLSTQLGPSCSFVTEDYLFLFDQVEAKEYFPNNEIRRWPFGAGGPRWMDGLRELAWGLRDLHDVRPQGNVSRTPTFRGSSKILVRPAFWMTICH